MSPEALKQAVAQAALAHLPQDGIIGMGTGSTVNCLLDALADRAHQYEGAVASSIATAERLQALNIPLVELNAVSQLGVYIDGADEVDRHGYCIKGGGGAHTCEKLVATAAKQFICIVDHRKLVSVLGSTHPLPIEVLPMARSLVGRAIVALGGDPVYRDGFITDSGNHILDVHHLDISQPLALETTLNNIPGVVAHGLFAKRKADIVLIAQADGRIETLHCSSRS